LQKEEELTREAIEQKMKALRLQEDMHTLRDNYDAQIEDLSNKLIETMTAQHRR
jgi:hypothetical protein